MMWNFILKWPFELFIRTLQNVCSFFIVMCDTTKENTFYLMRICVIYMVTNIQLRSSSFFPRYNPVRPNSKSINRKKLSKWFREKLNSVPSINNWNSVLYLPVSYMFLIYVWCNYIYNIFISKTSILSLYGLSTLEPWYPTDQEAH